MKVNSIQVLNPGSCEQPRDRGLRASYAILDTENNVYEQYGVEYYVGKVLLELQLLKLQ
ncbi:MAG: hypothetical protein QXH02_01760 [Desulfurococcaceae archaeon]